MSIFKPLFMAPEVLKKNYNEKCDIWACGLILYLMLSGELPFRGRSKEDIIVKILKAEYDFDSPPWKNVSRDAKAFIRKLLVLEPQNRYSAEQALRDPWINASHRRLTDLAISENALNNLRVYRVSSSDT